MAVEERFELRGRGLREHLARGSLINAAFLTGVATLALARGFVMAGLLDAEDFGVWGILAVALGTIFWLRQVGIGDKYVQQDEDDQERAFHKAFTLEAATIGIFGLVMAALVPLVALVYGLPELLAPGLVMLLILPAGVLQVPLWIHYRRMAFGRQRLIQSADPIVGIVVAVALAVAGAGYWALIVGALAGAWAAGLLATLTSPYRLRFAYERGTLREYFTFSWPLAIAGGSGLIIAQASLLLGEAELGLAAAGAITLASQITLYTDKVDEIVTGTLYPAICSVRDRADLLRESFVKSNRIALIWAVPFGVGLTLFADDLVTFAIGERWRLAVPLLQVFGLTAAVGHLGFNWSAYYRARGETRPIAVVAAVTVVAFVLAVVPLIRAYGMEGFAAAIAVQAGVNLLARSLYLARLFGGFSMLAHAARAAAPSVPAAGAVLLLRAVEDGERTGLMALGELVLYVAVTAVATAVLERALLREAAGYVRGGVRPVPAA